MIPIGSVPRTNFLMLPNPDEKKPENQGDSKEASFLPDGDNVAEKPADKPSVLFELARRAPGRPLRLNYRRKPGNDGPPTIHIHGPVHVHINKTNNAIHKSAVDAARAARAKAGGGGDGE